MEADEFCPCCGYNTLDEMDRWNYAICPVCYWEDDPVALQAPESAGGANRVSLVQARKNYAAFGACEKAMAPHVRKPNSRERRK